MGERDMEPMAPLVELWVKEGVLPKYESAVSTPASAGGITPVSAGGVSVGSSSGMGPVGGGSAQPMSGS